MSIAMNNVYNMVMDEDANLDTLEDTLQCIEASVEEKVENGIKLIKAIQAFADSVKAEKEFHEKRLKVLDNRIKRIKEYYKMNLALIGKEKITTPVGTMALQKSPAALQIIDNQLLPAEYLTIVPEHYEPNKDKIKAALKDDIYIPGAHLVQGKHLRIR